MSEFKILSHACATVTAGGKSIIFDPWLLGSCYWRSWWNYPPVDNELVQSIQVDAIYLTHVHWDHWHGPTLKKLFSKDTLIVTHDEPNGRSIRDLYSIGFRNIKVLKHGQSHTVGDIKISIYQFGLFLNDSAVVIETPDVKILNANDCKIAGSALRYILRKHGRFDFALRSHSSANDRVCYKINGSNVELDDPLHYSRSFGLFMEAVKPKYAVPFASNHCHLHKDVVQFNSIINDPYSLKEYLESEFKMTEDVELKIMLSGDSWSSKDGFKINPLNESFFINREERISQYISVVKNKLEDFYSIENKITPNSKIFSLFEKQIKCIPKVLRLKFYNYSYKLILFNDVSEYHYEVEVFQGLIKEVQPEYHNGSVVRMPIKVFVDSVVMNMFHHSSISKRNSYEFDNTILFHKFETFQDLLEMVELELFPVSPAYLKKMMFTYARRWREVFIYLHAFILRRRGMPIYSVEEEILKGT